MPFKLIGTIVLVVLVATFTGFNLVGGEGDHVSDIWFFHNFKNVPVLVTMLISFLLGVLVTLPFTFGRKGKSKEEKEKAKADKKLKKDSKGEKKTPVYSEEKEENNSVPAVTAEKSADVEK